jgi:hypothetical protein
VKTLLEDIHAQPITEFHHALLMARGVEVTALTGECQEIFLTEVFAFHAGNAVV